MTKLSRAQILLCILYWFNFPARDVLRDIRVLEKPIRLGYSRRLKAIRYDSKTHSGPVEFAVVGRKDRTYNPHREGCWTPSDELSNRDLIRIQRELFRRAGENVPYYILDPNPCTWPTKAKWVFDPEFWGFKPIMGEPGSGKAYHINRP